jgi:hypothetical protein
VQACAGAAEWHAAPVYCARHLAPGATDLVRALRARGRGVHALIRRGADLGFAVEVDRSPPSPAAALARWRAAEPVFLPGILGQRPLRWAGAIDRSLRMFDRLRNGGTLLDELEPRLAEDANLRYAGSTIDRSDPREIERVFVDAEVDGQPIAQDLWAMLAWIANDESDRSLRIRFSAGKDRVEDWLQTTDLTAGWVDQFASRAFPECEAILLCAELRRCLDALLARPYRLSERILYNNAPGGGAVFHHDAEPGQLGVCFSQLQGMTAWLSIGKRRLARLLHQRRACASQRAAMAALDQNDDRALWQLMNRSAEFTALLAAHGALFVLHAGDSILLPSHGIDDVAWHSVLALGPKPSLAHSYGLFAAACDYPLAADPWRQ